jgi:hypothetical protein
MEETLLKELGVYKRKRKMGWQTGSSDQAPA